MSQPSGEPQPDTDLPAATSLRGTYQQIKADPLVQQAAQDVSDAHPQGQPLRGLRATAGAVRAGYNLGSDPANADLFGQSAATHFGFVGDAQTHGTFTNSDGGPELATAESVDALHAKVDALGGSGGDQGGGAPAAAQNSNLQGLTPSRMPPRQAPPGRPPSPTQQDFAAVRVNQAGQRQATSASLAGATASLGRRAASWVSPGGMQAVQPTGNGMGQTTQDATMSGALKGTPDETQLRRWAVGQFV